MKKILFLAIAVGLTVNANAQGFLNALKSAASAAADKIVSTTEVSLPGTWTYNGCAINATSDNTLANIAAAAGTGTVESKVDEALSKVGIKSGVATFKFTEDSNFTFSCGKISLPGTYTVAEGGAITMNFSKLINIKLTGTVKNTTSGCEILFDATKFLELVKKICSVLGGTSSNAVIAAAQSAISGVTGLQLGFKLSK